MAMDTRELQRVFLASADHEQLQQAGNVSYKQLLDEVKELRVRNEAYKSQNDRLLSALPQLLYTNTAADSEPTHPQASGAEPNVASWAHSRTTLGLGKKLPGPLKKPAGVTFHYWYKSQWTTRTKGGYGATQLPPITSGDPQEEKNTAQLYIEEVVDGTDEVRPISGLVAARLRDHGNTLLHSLVWSGQFASKATFLSYEARAYIFNSLTYHCPAFGWCSDGLWKMEVFLSQLYPTFRRNHGQSSLSLVPIPLKSEDDNVKVDDSASDTTLTKRGRPTPTDDPPNWYQSDNPAKRSRNTVSLPSSDTPILITDGPAHASSSSTLFGAELLQDAVLSNAAAYATPDSTATVAVPADSAASNNTPPPTGCESTMHDTPVPTSTPGGADATDATPASDTAAISEMSSRDLIASTTTVHRHDTASGPAVSLHSAASGPATPPHDTTGTAIIIPPAAAQPMASTSALLDSTSSSSTPDLLLTLSTPHTMTDTSAQHPAQTANAPVSDPNVSASSKPPAALVTRPFAPIRREGLRRSAVGLTHGAEAAPRASTDSEVPELSSRPPKKSDLQLAREKYDPSKVSDKNMFIGQQLALNPDVNMGEVIKLYAELLKDSAKRKELKAVVALARKNKRDGGSLAAGTPTSEPTTASTTSQVD